MKGYVYSLWSGRFLCKECEINLKPSMLDGTLTAVYDGKRLGVANAPAEVYNAMVWFRDRDDNRAAAILIKYQRRQIAKLEEKIDNHKNKIDILSKGIKEVENAE